MNLLRVSGLPSALLGPTSPWAPDTSAHTAKAPFQAEQPERPKEWGLHPFNCWGPTQLKLSSARTGPGTEHRTETHVHVASDLGDEGILQKLRPFTQSSTCPHLAQ